MGAVEPLAVISLDRRVLWEDNDTEQWRFDGARIVRDINPEWELTVNEVNELIMSPKVEIPPGTRFVLFGRWVRTRDYCGEWDAWIEDVSLVPISRDAK